MTCQEFLVRHTEYLDELLSPQKAKRLEAHLAECTSCARYDRVVRQGTDLVRAAPQVEPSSDFFPRLQHRLYHLEDELRAGARGPGASAVVSLAIAGVLALLAWSPLMRLDQVLIPVPTTNDGWSAELSEPEVRPAASPEFRAPSSIRPIEVNEPDWFYLQLNRPGDGISSLVSDRVPPSQGSRPREWRRMHGDFAPETPWLAPRLSMPYLPLLTGESLATPTGDTLSPHN